MQAASFTTQLDKPKVMPTLEFLADLYGLRVKTIQIYADGVDHNFTTITPTIANNNDVVRVIREVNDGEIDAFVWDAEIVLNALQSIENDKSICVYALQKRVRPFGE